MPAYVTLGTDVETDQVITIGDLERRSGLYILGRPRTGKTTLMKNILLQDIENRHGVFFLDPHGDAIEDLQKRIPARRQGDVIILDPTDSEFGFGMNLLACADITRLGEREKTFDQAITGDENEKCTRSVRKSMPSILQALLGRFGLFPLSHLCQVAK